MSVDHKHIKKLYGEVSQKELLAVYHEWAEGYDQDSVIKDQYVAPKTAVSMMLPMLQDKSASIIDCGCGTGIVGDLLHQQGYQQIDGLDFSPDMLKIAREKGIYGKLFTGDLNVKGEVKDATYDHAFCIGSFTYGHVYPSGLDEILRMLKKGGLICFSINEGVYVKDHYEEKLNDLTQKNIAKLIIKEKLPYIINEQIDAFYIILEKMT